MQYSKQNANNKSQIVVHQLINPIGHIYLPRYAIRCHPVRLIVYNLHFIMWNSCLTFTGCRVDGGALFDRLALWHRAQACTKSRTSLVTHSFTNCEGFRFSRILRFSFFEQPSGYCFICTYVKIDWNSPQTSDMFTTCLQTVMWPIPVLGRSYMSHRGLLWH